jgi:hypothetical protein
MPGQYLDIDKHEAEELERIGACLILSGVEKNDNTADTKTRTDNSADRLPGVIDKLKDVYTSGRDKRRRADRTDSKKRGRKDRKVNSKKAD